MLTIFLVSAVCVGTAGADSCSYHGTVITGTGGIISESGNYYLASDTSLTTNNITISGENTVVNLCLNGHVLNGTGTGNVITISNGATLNLYDCGNLAHSFAVDEITGLWKWVDSEGEQTVNGGVITGGTSGGISLTGGNFTMYSGSIVGISGGSAVSMAENGGWFVMNDGSIMGNTATWGSCVMVHNNCRFVMLDGCLSYNNASNSGSVIVHGTGIFEMKGGEISNNHAVVQSGGVQVQDGGTFVLVDGLISGNNAKKGGGVLLYQNSGASCPIFEMKGGRLSNNHATEGYGGGVSTWEHVIFNMSGGIIESNYANTDGSGVYVYHSGVTFNMSGSATIDDNNDVYFGGSNSGAESYVTLKTDEKFTGSARNITGTTETIKTNHKLIRLEGEGFTASDILDRFSLKSIHSQLSLAPSSDNKNIIVTDMPVVNASTVKTTAYNSTTANVTFALQTHSGATGYYVNLTNGTDVFYNYTTVSIDAGGEVRDVQVEGLTGGKIYTLTITPLKDEGTPNVYTHPTEYTAPEVSSVTLEDGAESKVLDINGESSGTLSAVVKDKDGNVLKEILQWESGDTDILSFDENGEYTLHKKGDVTITVNVSSKEEMKDTIKISVIDTTPIEPNLPITEPTKDNDGNTTITGTVTVKDEHTAEIEGDGVTIIVEFKEGTGLTQGQPVKGNVTNVLASYDEASASTGETVNGVVNYQLNLTLKNVTTYLPKINATLNTTIKNAVEDLGFKTVSMITAESNITEINKNLTTGSVEIVFTVPTLWYDSVDIFSFHYKDTQLVGTPQPIPTSNIERGTTTTKITLYVDEFSTHGIAGKPKTVTPTADDDSASSSSQGSSVWLMETQTPTPTPTATPTQTDTVPTDIPSTKPTETPDSPAPILGILASLGFCVAAMRRR